MTERKPRGMSWTSWIDQQVDEAKERGAFDNLPGTGKPLPDRGDEDFGQAWLREWVQREGVSVDEMLPPPLKLRKKRELLAQRAPGMRSEQDVRDAVTALNQEIMEWRRIPVGPPIFVPLVDEDKMVGLWRDAQPATQPASAVADTAHTAHTADTAHTAHTAHPANTAHPAGPDASGYRRQRERRPWWRRRPPAR